MNSSKADKIKDILARAGIPALEVQAYGQQITVECIGRNTAERAAFLLGHAFKIRGMIKAAVDAKENKGTCLLPTKRIVWRVYACLKDCPSPVLHST